MNRRHRTAVPGTLRAERLQVEKVARETWTRRLMAKLKRERETPRHFNVVGLKRQYVNGLDGIVLTPYYAKLRRRRRAARRVAHESRRRNFNA